MRAAAHAADSILEGLETEDTEYISFNALTSIYPGWFVYCAGLSVRMMVTFGSQVKQTPAQQELPSLES